MRDRIAKANLEPLENEIRKYILRKFARNGKAPTYREILEELKLSSVDMVNQTIEKLERADILQKRGNEIISAYPFSALETRHNMSQEREISLNYLISRYFFVELQNIACRLS